MLWILMKTEFLTKNLDSFEGPSNKKINVQIYSAFRGPSEAPNPIPWFREISGQAMIRTKSFSLNSQSGLKKSHRAIAKKNNFFIPKIFKRIEKVEFLRKNLKFKFYTIENIIKAREKLFPPDASIQFKMLDPRCRLRKSDPPIWSLHKLWIER